MAKLQLLIEMDIDSTESRLTSYKRIIHNFDQNKDDKTYKLQGVKLFNFKIVNDPVQKHYLETIARLVECMNDRFADIISSTIFENLVSLLDVQSWPKGSMIEAFGDTAICKLADSFCEVLEMNKCNVDMVMSDWDSLKSYVVPILSNSKDKYTDIWPKIFTNSSMQHECPNMLMIFELLMVAPFTNAKAEQMFSHMARVKTDWRNCLGRD